MVMLITFLSLTARARVISNLKLWSVSLIRCALVLVATVASPIMSLYEKFIVSNEVFCVKKQI